MADKLKITIIGGGSYAWTPTIFRDLVVTEELEGSTICLEDIDPAALRDQERLARKILKTSGRKVKLQSTTSQAEALDGANFVILTISTGGLDAMEHDIGIPLKYGIYQAVGDTVGPGGLARALRNIPVVVGIGHDMEKHCPNAWMINYTNPMTTLTRAMWRYTRTRTIGLCHELFGTLSFIAQLFGIEDRHEIEVQAAGINHLLWILSMRIRGEDGFEMLRRYLADHKAFGRKRVVRKSGQETTHAQTLTGSHQVKLALFEAFGALPAAGDRHVAEFFPHFLTEATHSGVDWGVHLTTVAERKTSWLPGAITRTKEMLAGKRAIELTRSGETASLIIAALAGRRPPLIDVMNLPNQGQVPELPLDVVVETMAGADRVGARGLAAGRLPMGVLNVLMTHVINQELVVEAAMTGDRHLALQALLNDPLTRDFKDAHKMLDEMIEANHKLLPQF